MARHISPEKAREIAYSWHGGQWSPLYAFASSGLIANHGALLGEIRQCQSLTESKTELRQLIGLFRFARDCVAKTPSEEFPFIAPWAKGNQ